MPNTRYVGGDKLVFDWVKSNEVKYSNLVEFSEKAGVKGERKHIKYHVRVRDGTFRFLGDDDVIRECASCFLFDAREMHVFVEEVQVDPEDPKGVLPA